MEAKTPPRRIALTEGGILRPLLHLAVPFAVGNVLNLLNLTIDRLWVGRVGTEALAALGMAHSALMVLMVTAMGMAVGTLAGVAQSVGAGRPAEASRYFGQGLYIALTLGIVVAVGAIWLPEPIMAWMGAQPGVADPATAYLRIGMAGMVAQAPLLAVTFALQGAGEARAALHLSTVAPILNTALDPLFIFGLDLGMPGAAWATLVAVAAATAVGLYLVTGGRTSLRLGRDAFVVRPGILRRIVAVGFPGSLEHVVRTVAGFALVTILTAFGPAVLSAYTAANVVIMMLIFPGLALGQAAASLVGQNLGAGRPARAWRTAWASAGLYVSVMIALGTAVWLGADTLVAVFDDNPAVVREGRRLLRIVSLCFPFIAVALTLSKSFGGAGRTLPAMTAAAVAHLLVQIPLAVLLSREAGPVGAYVAMASAFALHGLLSATLFVRYFRGWRRGAGAGLDERTVGRDGRGISSPWQGDRKRGPG